MGVIVWRIILLGRIRTTRKHEYVGLIINYVKKMTTGGFNKVIMGIHI